MIGDDVSADLGDGAIEMGFHRYLGKQLIQESTLNQSSNYCCCKVKTGKYKEGDEDKLKTDSMNDRSKAFNSIVEAIDHVLQ
jgi:hypothetical protein